MEDTTQKMTIDQAVDAELDRQLPPETVQPAIVREPINHRAPRVIEPVPIELDKTRHLRLPFWALKMFEARTGVNAWDSEKIFEWPPKLEIVTTLLWVGLLDEDDSLTLEQVERMPGLEFGNIYYILHCLDELWGKNQPPPDPATASGGTAPKPSAVRPTGSVSGRSDAKISA